MKNNLKQIMYHYPAWQSATNVIDLSHSQHSNAAKNCLTALKGKLLCKG